MIQRLKGTVFWQLRLLAGGGGVLSAIEVADMATSTSVATDKMLKPARMEMPSGG
jgi:hypothetical protein